MDFGEIILFIVCLIVMFVGLVGVVIPFLPGVPLVLVGTFLYGIITGFGVITWNIILIFIILTGFTFLLDWIATAYGVKKMGASKLGMVGAILGMIVGLFSGGLIGLIFGSFLGAFIFELLAGKTERQALKAGSGAFIGILLSGLAKFIIGSVMIGIFVWKVLFF